jgi:endonuclease YncB( thermonuclease family)
VRTAVALLALAGLAAAGLLMLGLRDEPAGKAAGEEPSAEHGVSRAADDVPTSSATLPRPEPSRVRSIAPEIVATPPIRRDTLVRVEPRGPLSPIGPAPSPLDSPPEETLLHRPSTTAAGAFEAQGYRVRLAGIVPTPSDEMCDSGGVPWPCGVYARTAFRNWLRGRALACVVPPAPPDDTLVLDCMRGKQNPAEWLVSQGWARAAEGGPYAALEEEARREGLGIFGPAPLVSRRLRD